MADDPTIDSARLLTSWRCPYGESGCGDGGFFCVRCDIDLREIVEDDRPYVFRDNPPAKSSTCVWNIDGVGNSKGKRRW
jgi:hypothetical protein